VDVTLVGGGWDLPAQVSCLRPYLRAATARAGNGIPRIAFVWVDEGDGTHWGSRWTELVGAAGPVDALDVAVPIGTGLDVGRVHGADAVFVCGGLTPAYAEVLAPAAAGLRRLVFDEGIPYAGSSAGAAVAARIAVVGGYLDGERVVCPPDAAEDLDPVTVVPGLGLVEEMVDVHASAWGTLPRLAAAMAMAIAADVAVGLGLDEDTAWHVTDVGVEVLGRNAVHRLERDGDGVRWSVTVPSTDR
jgi:cyanophycinase